MTTEDIDPRGPGPFFQVRFRLDPEDSRGYAFQIREALLRLAEHRSVPFYVTNARDQRIGYCGYLGGRCTQFCDYKGRARRCVLPASHEENHDSGDGIRWPVASSPSPRTGE